MNDFGTSSDHSNSTRSVNRRSSLALMFEEEESTNMTAGSEDVKQRKAAKKRISFTDDVSTGSKSSGTRKKPGSESKLSLKVV